MPDKNYGYGTKKYFVASKFESIRAKDKFCRKKITCIGRVVPDWILSVAAVTETWLNTCYTEHHKPVHYHLVFKFAVTMNVALLLEHLLHNLETGSISLLKFDKKTQKLSPTSTMMSAIKGQWRPSKQACFLYPWTWQGPYWICRQNRLIAYSICQTLSCN